MFNDQISDVDVTIILENNQDQTFSWARDLLRTPLGQSYLVAINAGFSGTYQNWTNTLKVVSPPPAPVLSDLDRVKHLNPGTSDEWCRQVVEHENVYMGLVRLGYTGSLTDHLKSSRGPVGPQRASLREQSPIMKTHSESEEPTLYAREDNFNPVVHQQITTALQQATQYSYSPLSEPHLLWWNLSSVVDQLKQVLGAGTDRRAFRVSFRYSGVWECHPTDSTLSSCAALEVTLHYPDDGNRLFYIVAVEQDLAILGSYSELPRVLQDGDKFHSLKRWCKVKEYNLSVTDKGIHDIFVHASGNYYITALQYGYQGSFKQFLDNDESVNISNQGPANNAQLTTQEEYIVPIIDRAIKEFVVYQRQHADVFLDTVEKLLGSSDVDRVIVYTGSDSEVCIGDTIRSMIKMLHDPEIYPNRRFQVLHGHEPDFWAAVEDHKHTGNLMVINALSFGLEDNHELDVVFDRDEQSYHLICLAVDNLEKPDYVY